MAAIPAALKSAARNARRVCVLTGAGVSAESGVPTFRDAQTGLWAQYDPRELATPDAFLKDPALVWRWYRWRRELVTGVEPNPGHLALARFGHLVPQLCLITQNVDGLHQRAGSTDVIEFHGNMFVDRCFDCGAAGAADAAEPVPTCAACGGRMRPGVVWFGEEIPDAAMRRATTAVAACDLFFSVGTSAAVWPAAGFAEQARRGGAIIVEVNPATTELTDLCDYRLAGQSGVVLPELVDCLSGND